MSAKVPLRNHSRIKSKVFSSPDNLDSRVIAFTRRPNAQPHRLAQRTKSYTLGPFAVSMGTRSELRHISCPPRDVICGQRRDYSSSLSRRLGPAETQISWLLAIDSV